MRGDPELVFKHDLALALGKSLWEVDQMPGPEYQSWLCYHKVKGLPTLDQLFANLCFTVACSFGDPKRPPRLEDFYLRPVVLPPGPVNLVNYLDAKIRGT